MEGQRTLITGGAGLVGSHIADQLVRAGAREVVVLDNFVPGRRENLAWALANGPVRIVEGDIRDRDLLGRLLPGVDTVFHQAAIRITQCAEEPRLALEVLADGTFNVLEAAAAAGVGKVVAASSASVYGLAERFPTDERHHLYGNRTMYGAAKAFNEGLLRSFHDMYKLRYLALRYFNIYGPRMDVHGVYTEVLVRWMERIAAGQPPLILGDGSQTMDFVYSEDVARANLAATASDASDEVVNVASGVETSLDDLAKGAPAGDGLGPTAGIRPRAGRQPRRQAPGRHHRGAGAARLRGVGGPRGRAWAAGGLVARGAEPPAVIPVMKPWLGEEEARAAAEVVVSGRVAQGPRVAAFEAAVGERVGAAHGVATSSCTTALHLSLVVLGIGPEDEVVVPSLSFIATANVVRHVGARPVFADVEPDTFNLSAETIKQALSPRTRAVILVHQGGMPGDVAAVHALCDPLGVEVVEDAACALGSTYRGRPVGDSSNLVAFSFHPRKVITTGEGGMVMTSRRDCAERLRRLREHGMNVSAAARHAAPTPILERYLEPRLQLPHDRHPGGRRAGPARPPGRHGGPAAGAGGPIPRAPDRGAGAGHTGGPAVRDDQLPVVLAPAGRRLPGRPRRAVAAADGQGRLGAPRHHGRPPGAGLCRRARGGAAGHRAPDPPFADPAAVPHHDHAGAGPGGRVGARRGGGGSPVSRRPLLIVGAGGFGRETAEGDRAAEEERPRWDLLGFLDDDPMLQGQEVEGIPVVGPLSAVERLADAMLVVSVGHPGNYYARQRIVRRLALDPSRYATIVHPAAVVPPSAELGRGTVLLATVVATTGVRIGAHVAVMPGVVLTYDDSVADYATLGAGVRLAGGVRIREGAYVGAGALVREHRTVGAWALVGMGAVVTDDVPAREVWAGVPARFLRRVAEPSDPPTKPAPSPLAG
jgi:sugar O-acyltransferase (sialic acid O-acetyltransferase NeuD family)